MKVLYLTSLVVLFSSTLAIAPTKKEIFVCEDCIQYYPKHWEEDGFPPILMIRN
jgi:hypothetical protein